ncbi:hypothetical protein Pmani_000894 [Petrolisthes manimaculis]|uniref:Uncharacterized protein n=1 Tax=Petrolisthes manimaculis TaxID=1843537 RepID=A0AAE1UKT9_9EUCA|nr:hypothetical protein Pmani_000894 [Petrolisthes manimaculis]
MSGLSSWDIVATESHFVVVHGNEQAYVLTRAAASSDQPPAKCHAEPAVDLRLYIDAAIRSCWLDIWDAVEATKLQGTLQHQGLWSYCGLYRRWETALARLHIGHSRLTNGLFLMERASPPFCDDCLVPLTVPHLLVDIFMGPLLVPL